MPRRIQLPSSSELFDDPAPRPGRAAHDTAPAQTDHDAARTAPRRRGRAVTASPRQQRTRAEADAPRPRAVEQTPRQARSAAKAPSDERGQHRPKATSPALTRRMAQVEGMLGDLPIDTLIDLRDGLEAVLAADAIDEKELAALLALGR